MNREILRRVDTNAAFKMWESSHDNYLDKWPRKYQAHVISLVQVHRARHARIAGQGI